MISKSATLVIGLALMTASMAFGASVDTKSNDDARDDSVVLRAGNVHRDRIAADDAVVTSERLRAFGEILPRGKRYTLVAESAGPHHVTFTSYTVRGHLVLRDAAGRVIAEDDVSWMNLLPRLVFDASAETRYTLDVASVYGVPGPFEIRFDAGPLPATPPQQDARRAADFVREGVAAAESDDGIPTPGLGVALGRLAYLQQAQGRAGEAERTYRRALDVRERVLSEHHPELVETLFGLARAVASRDLEAAIPIYERALATLEQAPYENDLISAHLRHAVGTAHFHRNRFEEAKTWLGEAAEIFERAAGPDADATLRATSDLASAHFQRGQYDEAIPIFERVLATTERVHGPNHLLTIETLFNLAMAERDRGEHRKALARFQRAHDGCVEAFGPDHEFVARCLEGLAAARIALHEYEPARDLLERALAIREVRNGSNDFMTAGTLHELGHATFQLGILDESRVLLERSLAIRREVHGPGHPLTARTMQNLAAVLAGLGLFEEALALSEPAARILEASYVPTHPLTITALELHAGVLQELGRYGEARPVNERVVKLNEQRHGADSFQAANSKHNLALLARRNGDLERAERIWRESLAIWERVDPGHSYAAAAAGELGRLLRQAGRIDDAIAVLDRIEPRRDPRFPSTEVLNFDTGRALTLLDRGATREAFAVARDIEAGYGTLARHVLWTMTEHERLRFAARYAMVLDVLLSIAIASDDDEIHREAYESFLAWKGRVARSLVRGKAAGRRALDREHHDLTDRLSVIQSRLSTLAFARGGAGAPDAARELESLRAERIRLERELLRAGGDDDEDDAVDLDTLRGSIPADVALVDFARFVRCVPAANGSPPRFEEAVCAWVIRPAPRKIVAIDLGNATAIGRALVDYRRSLTNRPGQERMSRGTSGATLRRLVWDPIAPHVAGSRHLVVSPTGYLASLPLEAIVLEDGSYLIERHAVTYLQHMTAFPRANAASSMESHPSLLAIGGIDYDRRDEPAIARAGGSGDDRRTPAKLPDESEDRRVAASAPPPETTPSDDDCSASELRAFSRSWAPLPSSKGEVRAIADIHEQTFEERATRIEGAAATEERVKHELPRHRAVHIATHGFFRPDDLPSLWTAAHERDLGGASPRARLASWLPGLRSGLVFSGANTPSADGRDEGILTAEEITFLDLGAVDLVVLSACETALGSPQSGEALLGLRRSLHQAGVDTVISSAWQVEDAATAWLMREFYRRLWVLGESRRDALHGARLALAEHNRKTFGGDPRPETWGAFVLSGAWR